MLACLFFFGSNSLVLHTPDEKLVDTHTWREIYHCSHCKSEPSSWNEPVKHKRRNTSLLPTGTCGRKLGQMRPQRLLTWHLGFLGRSEKRQHWQKLKKQNVMHEILIVNQDFKDRSCCGRVQVGRASAGGPPSTIKACKVSRSDRGSPTTVSVMCLEYS